MEILKKILLFPFVATGTIVKVTGRIACGAVGFVLMGGGLLLIEPLHLAPFGIPVFLVGLLLLIRAIF